MPRLRALMHLVVPTLALLLAAPGAHADEGAGSLSIRINGLHSAEGQVLIVVYRGEEGFPKDPAQAFKKVAVPISDGRASFALKDVPVGDYAVVVVHDENNNNDLDTSWIGIPKEGIGTSNNAKGRMGPPKYRDAKFAVTTAGALQNIQIVYL